LHKSLLFALFVLVLLGSVSISRVQKVSTNKNICGSAEVELFVTVPRNGERERERQEGLLCNKFKPSANITLFTVELKLKASAFHNHCYFPQEAEVFRNVFHAILLAICSILSMEASQPTDELFQYTSSHSPQEPVKIKEKLSVDDS
jgi:hypothetical protein